MPSVVIIVSLLCRIIMASTKQGDWILDPFAGSSTTGIAANLLGRRFLGIEKEEKFVKISKARREEIEDINIFVSYKKKISDIVKAEDTQTDCFVINDTIIEKFPFGEDEPTMAGNDVLMFAIGGAFRRKTEPLGKLAVGLKENLINDFTNSKINYIMFHYWKNEKATLYRITNCPRIVDKQDIPSGYLLRLDTNAVKFILVEYDPSKPADIGVYNINKVQRKGRGRYLPFVTSVNSIKL